MNTFNWALIPSFIAVIEQGNLSNAAKVMHVSQPTLSRHIVELEVQLQTTLFDRTRKGLEATASANHLYKTAKQMQHSAFAIEERIESNQTVKSGKVRITATQPVAYSLLIPILSELRQIYTDIDIELVVNNQLDNLLEREADIALRMNRPTQSALIAKKLTNLNIGFFAHKSYIDSYGQPLALTELILHNLVGNYKNKNIIDGAKAFGLDFKFDDFCMRSDDLYAQWLAVQSGMGISLVAHHLAKQDSNVIHVLDEFRYPLPLWLTAHPTLKTSRVMRIVFDFISDRLQFLP